MEVSKKDIIEVMQEVGIYIDGEVNDNHLNDYFEDSLHFMSFIVKVEERFEIEFPNELLVFENFNTIDGIKDMIQQLKK